MSDLEKINIYVPRETEALLSSDNEMFEVFKRGGKSVNRNLFLSMLVIGYYDAYIQERRNKHARIMSELDAVDLDVAQKTMLASRILEDVFLPARSKRLGKNARHLSLKPTEKTEHLLSKIRYDNQEADSLSMFLCRMFMSYCEKPFSQRERIIFRQSHDTLTEACKRRQPICFSIAGNDYIHEVIPYAIATGQEEMFNYLLCQEENPKTRMQEACVFRLNRIRGINISDKTGSLQDDVQAKLERMKRIGPQYAINDDDEVCVKLTMKGKDLYKRIYFGRPLFEREENAADGYLQYYMCSHNQLELYFRRFGPEAEILYPQTLRDKIAEFHRCSLRVYEDGLNNDTGYSSSSKYIENPSSTIASS